MKEAILKMDIYATSRAGHARRARIVGAPRRRRTPIREAIAMLEQDGFVKTVPRRGIVVVRRTKSEIVDTDPGLGRASRAWQQGLITFTSPRAKGTFPRCAIFSRISARTGCRRISVEEYSKANIAFHQALISLGESPGAGRHDQRYPAACARLPAADDRTRRPHRDLAARTYRHHRGARRARHRASWKSAPAIIRSALPLMSKRTAKSCFNQPRL